MGKGGSYGLSAVREGDWNNMSLYISRSPACFGGRLEGLVA